MQSTATTNFRTADLLIAPSYAEVGGTHSYFGKVLCEGKQILEVNYVPRG